MSIHLMSLVWEVSFPTPTQKLLMLRVADYAHDDGDGIYPSVGEVARQIGGSERQTQYAIKALEAAGLLSRVREGGGGVKSTNVWSIDVDLLGKLALQEMALTGSHDCLEAVENTGANIAPRTIARVQSRLRAVQSATARGATDCTQTIKNHQIEPSGANARANDDVRAAPALKKPTPQHMLTPNDPSWGHWITWLTDRDRRDLVAAAEEALRMVVVGSKWPTDSSPFPAIGVAEKPSAISQEITKRMVGER